jgi:hypothetical protein
MRRRDPIAVAVHFGSGGFATCADSDEAGHAFQIESGHPFRFEAGHRSDLKSATVAAFRRVEKMLFLFLDLGQAG